MKLDGITDYHTHNLLAPAGSIINVPQEWLLHPSEAEWRKGSLYSVGIHPWWTTDSLNLDEMLHNLPTLLARPEVVALGECGLDALQGASLDEQERILARQVELSEVYRLPLTLHIVRTFDRLLAIRKRLRPTQQWTVHGFRGKPALARQLLHAGINLSFGELRNEDSFALTPLDMRYTETD